MISKQTPAILKPPQQEADAFMVKLLRNSCKKHKVQQLLPRFHTLDHVINYARAHNNVRVYAVAIDMLISMRGMASFWPDGMNKDQFMTECEVLEARLKTEMKEKAYV